MFSVHEYNGILAVGNKKKITLYTWSQPSNIPGSPAVVGGFQFRKETTNLTDTPKNIVCVSSCIIVGYKRTYEALDINTLNSTKILDVDKDQKMLCMEVSLVHSNPLISHSCNCNVNRFLLISVRLQYC